MNANGIVRSIDDLGRIVIPKEIRRRLSVKEWDQMEIYLDDDKIVITKYSPNINTTEDIDGCPCDSCLHCNGEGCKLDGEGCQTEMFEHYNKRG